MHVVCPHCDAVNRVPETRLRQGPKCGTCKEPLFDGKPAKLDETRFARHRDRNSIPVFVDFWAPWCGPCHAMAPAFEKAAGSLEPAMRLAKVNIDETQALAGALGIQSIPTLVMFAGGREVGRMSGAMGAEAIVRWAQSTAPRAAS